MAAVVIGGTLVSVAFFIFLVPVVYNFVDVLGIAIGWLLRTVFGLSESDDEQSTPDKPDTPEPVPGPAGR
jgi:hypothetical protein